IAVLGLGDVAWILVRRMAVGDENNSVEPEPPAGLVCRHQVAVVHGIKRAAHDPDSTHGHLPPHRGAPLLPGASAPAAPSAETTRRRSARCSRPLRPPPPAASPHPAGQSPQGATSAAAARAW